MPVAQSEAVANAANGLDVAEPNPHVGQTIGGRTDVVPATRHAIQWIDVENIDAADAWVFIYAAATGDVTPGTTAHVYRKHVPASAAPRVIPVLAGPLTAPWCVMVASAADGTGNPTTGCRIEIAYDRV